jgi:simple sugar transport system permease protein
MSNNTKNATAQPKVGKAMSPGKIDNNLIRLLVILVIVTVLMSLLNKEFFTLDTFSSMGFSFPEFGIMAIATMLAMLSGGIDLSLVGIANLAGIVAGLVFTKMMPVDTANPIGYMLLAIVVALVVGALAGLMNGFNIAKIGIPPILATLGAQQVFIGLAKGITGGPAVFGFPEAFTNLGINSLLGIPIPLIIFALFVVIFYIALNKTTYGLKLYMMGTNPRASAFAGIKNESVIMKTYMFCGMMAAIAGLIIMARSNSAKADYGLSYTLQVILIAVLGGVNPSGGFGKISGVVLAVLILQFLSTGFTMLQFPSTARGFIWGAVLLLTMIANFLLNSYGEKKRIRKQIELNN